LCDFILIPVPKANRLPVKAKFSSAIVEEPIYGITAEGFNGLLRSNTLIDLAAAAFTGSQYGRARELIAKMLRRKGSFR
jgi:hypothetical protein